MESKQIKQILKQFDATNTYKKIFINGDWGIGKSYYTNEYISENSDNIVYISLFGKSSFGAIENAITKELMNKLNKIEKFKKKAKQIAEGIDGSISLFGVSLSTPEVNRKTLIEKFSTLLDEKELIIIIDDLERKSGNILMEDIMGMIEEFSMFEKIKIVVIGDEKNIADDDLEKWKKFKEKIIEKEYKITTFSYDSIESLVIGRLEKYINKDLLEEFISSFLLKHSTNNLRTINKGINLFLEIVNNYLNENYIEKVYLCILKNCMAVAIEHTEELYKPNEDDKNSHDTSKSWMYSIDSDMETRILSHYFNSVFMNNKDSSILDYIIKLYSSEVNEELIKDFNSVLKNYISLDDEKNIFYLSQEGIIEKVTETYNKLIEDKYKFTSLEKFIDDVYELMIWNKELQLDLNITAISEKFNTIMFNNYYDINKELYQNQIDRFDLKQRQSAELKGLIDSFNSSVATTYIHDKIDYITNKYKENKLDTKYLEWLKWKFIQQDKEEAIEYFIKCCRDNNYFIPKLSDEIEENEWRWTHYIWYLFHDYLCDDYKKELNDYAESLKKETLIAEYRINSLQEYRPLVENKN